MPKTPDQWVVDYKFTSLDLSQEDLTQYVLNQTKATALSSVPKPQSLLQYSLQQPPINTLPSLIEYNNWIKSVQQAQSEALNQYLTNQPKPQPLNLPLSPAQVKAEYQEFLGGYKPVYKNNVNDLAPGIKEVFIQGAQQNLLKQNAQNLTDYFENLPSNTPNAQNSVSAPKTVSASALPGQVNPPASVPAFPPPVSPAALPATPASAGIQQSVDVLSGEPPKPPPATPKTSLSLPNPAPKAFPSALPPGTAPLLAVGAGLQFVGAVASGQSPGQAAVGATGSLTGGTLGTILGTPFGPIGQLIGGTVGSYAGSAIANGVWGLFNPNTMPAPASVAPDPITGPVLFTGGQCTGQYDITYTLKTSRKDGVTYSSKGGGRFWGPIGGFRVSHNSETQDVFEVLCHGGVSYVAASPRLDTQQWVQQNFDTPVLTIVSIDEVKYRNGLDNCGNPVPQPVPTPAAAPATINYNTTIVNNGGFEAPPSATPSASQTPKPNIYIPAWNPSLSNGTSNPDLSPDWISNGNPAGSLGYQNQPTNLGGDLPGMSPAIAPGLATGNSAIPWMVDNPATDQVFPQFQPAFAANPLTPSAPFTPTVFQPNPLTAGSLSTDLDLTSFSIPSGLLSTAKAEPIPDVNSPVPKAQSAPAPMPAPFKDPAMEEFQTKLDDLTNMMLPIVAFTTAFQGVPSQLTNIQNQTTPQAIQNAAAAGTCSTLQPGGCLTPLANNAQNAANNSQNALNSINANTPLIAQLLLQQGQIASTVGVGEFPATVPANTVHRKGVVPGTTTINNIPQMQAWHFRQNDAALGQWSAPVSVQGPPGTPTKEIDLDNMSEAMAENFGMQLAQIQALETVTNITTRSIIETGQIKQQLHKNYMMTQAIMDYMGFKYKETSVQMPMLFKPNADGLFGMLTETQQTLKGVQYDDKFNLQKVFTVLLEAARIIKAVFFRKIDTSKSLPEIKSEILGNLKKSSDLNKKINKLEKDADGKDDFDKFIENAQTAFRPLTGDDTPYDDPWSDRPKITRLGKTPLPNLPPEP